ncbi:MAG: recombination regulator RecX [Betaproteobacteria bacterium]|nr:recombination regulator RecX [Betaproteobacteria bacterium]
MTETGPGLRQRALRLLARREHSRAELERRLSPFADAGEIAALTAELQAGGLLSDARYAGSWVRSHASRHGSARLRHDLQRQGVDAETVERALRDEAGHNDLERALALWTRRFGTAPADAREYARQARFLQNRGFTADIVRKILRDPGIDSTS